jgi:hypothetical protein
MRRKSMFKILLITPLCPSVLSNIWTRPSCNSSPHPRTSYKESTPIMIETRNNLEPYLIFCQSLNLLQMSFEIQTSNNTKSPPLDKENINPGTIYNAWSKPTGYFQIFENYSLADILSNTWKAKIWISNYASGQLAQPPLWPSNLL